MVRARTPSACSGGAIGTGRGIGSRKSKFGSVPAVWNLDLDEMGSAFSQIVFSQAFPQPVRLDPNDRIPALIEVRSSAECLNRYVVLLYIVRGTLEKFGSNINEQLLQARELDRKSQT